MITVPPSNSCYPSSSLKNQLPTSIFKLQTFLTQLKVILTVLISRYPFTDVKKDSTNQYNTLHTCFLTLINYVDGLRNYSFFKTYVQCMKSLGYQETMCIGKVASHWYKGSWVYHNWRFTMSYLWEKTLYPLTKCIIKTFG